MPPRSSFLIRHGVFLWYVQKKPIRCVDVLTVINLKSLEGAPRRRAEQVAGGSAIIRPRVNHLRHPVPGDMRQLRRDGAPSGSFLVRHISLVRTKKPRVPKKPPRRNPFGVHLDQFGPDWGYFGLPARPAARVLFLAQNALKHKEASDSCDSRGPFHRRLFGQNPGTHLR